MSAKSDRLEFSTPNKVVYCNFQMAKEATAGISLERYQLYCRGRFLVDEAIVQSYLE